MLYVRPVKTQISLPIHIVWSEPFLVAWIFYECYATDWTSFWVSKLKRRLHRIVWVWAEPQGASVFNVFLSHKVFWVRCDTNCIDSWHLRSSLLFILTRVPTHKKYRILCYPLRSNSGWLPIRCAYFILFTFIERTFSWLCKNLIAVVQLYFKFTQAAFKIGYWNTVKVRKKTKIRNQYNQAPHLTQDTNGKVTT